VQEKVAIDRESSKAEGGNKRPLLIKSRWIAALPLSHVPTSKWDEILLMKRMGIAPLAAPVSSAPIEHTTPFSQRT
jgi:hypothetical protein